MGTDKIIAALRSAAQSGADDAVRDAAIEALRAVDLDELVPLLRSPDDFDALVVMLDRSTDDPLSGMVASALTADRAPELALDVLRAIGVTEPPAVAEAVAEEAGGIDLATAFDVLFPPVADAVAREAGEVSLADSVLAVVSLPAAAEADDLDAMHLSALLDQELAPATRDRVSARLAVDAAARQTLGDWVDIGRALKTTLRAEAGEVDVWERVSAGVGLPHPEHEPTYDIARLARAVAEEAGEIDLVERITARLNLREARAPTPARAPARAGYEMNGRWFLAAMTMVVGALAALMFALTPDPDPLGVASVDGFVESPVSFATANEISVEQVASGENGSVFVEMPARQDDPVIIWVNEGSMQ